MDSLRKQMLGFSLIVLAIIMLSGCTKKNNLTGNNWSDTHALSIDDKAGLIMGYSFPAETLNEIKGSEIKLLAGNYASATAISYLRWTGLPKSSTIATLEHADSCYIELNLLKRSPLPRNPLKLQLYKINKAWNDTLTTITDADLSIIPSAEYTVDDTISIVGKKIKLPLPISAIYAWESTADSTGWNLAIKAVNDGWVEIASAEVSSGPSMYIKYKTDTTATSFSTYSSKPVKDSYTLDAPLATASTDWKIDNLTSKRMFVQFNPTTTLFKDTDGSQLDSLAIRRLTINKATLVLHVKDNSYFTGASTFSLYPFNVVRDTVSALTPLIKADYETIVWTVSSLGLVVGDSVEIDITPIIQAYTSGDKSPKGIMIQSLQERQNFGYLEFWDCFTADSTKQPYVRIKYTPPFL